MFRLFGRRRNGAQTPQRRLDSYEIRARLLMERAMNEGSGDPVPTLLGSLEGADEAIRPTAAQLLGEVAGSVEKAAARREVVQALINALACPPLLRMIGPGIAADTRVALRIQAAEALGKYHEQGAVLELTEALRSEFQGVRRAAAWALGEIGAAEAIEALSEALPDGDGEARAAILAALGRIGTAEALDAIEVWKQARSKGHA